MKKDAEIQAIDDDALEFLADVCNGDARAALTAIELGILTTDACHTPMPLFGS